LGSLIEFGPVVVTLEGAHFSAPEGKKQVGTVVPVQVLVQFAT
jgi:hypothetical protein